MASIHVRVVMRSWFWTYGGPCSLATTEHLVPPCLAHGCRRRYRGPSFHSAWPAPRAEVLLLRRDGIPVDAHLDRDGLVAAAGVGGWMRETRNT